MQEKLLWKIEHLKGNRRFDRRGTQRELRSSSGTHFSAVQFVAFGGGLGATILINVP